MENSCDVCVVQLGCPVLILQNRRVSVCLDYTRSKRLWGSYVRERQKAFVPYLV